MAERRLRWLLAVVVAVLGAGLLLGSVAVSPLDALAALVGLGDDHETRAIVLGLRLPRTLLAMLVGAALAVAGVLTQVLTRNPLAEPGLLGASSGAGLAVLLLLTWFPWSAASPMALPAASIGGALAAAAVIALLARRQRGLSTLDLVLVGLAVNMLFGAAMSLVALSMPGLVHRALQAWLAGSLSNADPVLAIACAASLAVVLPAACFGARTLDVHLLGEEVPVALGVRLPRLRLWLMAGAVLLAGSAYAVAGGMPFVGLVAPHVARRLVGPRHAQLLPGSALVGACLVACADTLGRVVTARVETPAGILVAVLGGPWFLWLLLRAGRRAVA